ncbi:MAG TPA: T9SS type A sorting domain-containing protein [bacterium]|nr:T9SS type A sorting domain-containing protein [bacterium]
MIRERINWPGLLLFTLLLATSVLPADLRVRTIVTRNDKSIDGKLEMALQVQQDEQGSAIRYLHSFTCDIRYDPSILQPLPREEGIRWSAPDSLFYQNVFRQADGTARIALFARPNLTPKTFKEMSNGWWQVGKDWCTIAILGWRIKNTMDTAVPMKTSTLSAAYFRDNADARPLAAYWPTAAQGTDTLHLAPTITDSLECRLLLVQNDLRLDGKLRADFQLRILKGETPRTLQGIIADIFFSSELGMPQETPFFLLNTILAEQYDVAMVANPNFYHLALQGKSIGETARQGFFVTSEWQTLVTLEWEIGSSPYASLSIDEASLEAAYYNYLANQPDRGFTPWHLLSHDLGYVPLISEQAPPLMVRALVSRNEQLQSNKVDLVLQLKLGSTDTLRTLQAFCCDIIGQGNLSASLADPTVEWGLDLQDGYRCNLENKGAFYHIETHADGIGAGLAPGWNVLREWQTLVRLTMRGEAVNRIVFTLDSRSIKAAYFENPGNQPFGGWADWLVENLNVESEINAIELTHFTALRQNDHVVLSWLTQSETQNLGFNIYRSTDEQGYFLRLNKELIPGAMNSQAVQNYRFVDADIAAGNVYYYKISDIDVGGNETFHGPVAVVVSTPESHRLLPVYPNPFNDQVAIEFELSQTSKIEVMIYDLHGQQVKQLADEVQTSGYHRLAWDATDDSGKRVASGIYFVQFIADDFRLIQKMQYIR